MRPDQAKTLLDVILDRGGRTIEERGPLGDAARLRRLLADLPDHAVIAFEGEDGRLHAWNGAIGIRSGSCLELLTGEPLHADGSRIDKLP